MATNHTPAAFTDLDLTDIPAVRYCPGQRLRAGHHNAAVMALAVEITSRLPTALCTDQRTISNLAAVAAHLGEALRILTPGAQDGDAIALINDEGREAPILYTFGEWKAADAAAKAARNWKAW